MVFRKSKNLTRSLLVAIMPQTHLRSRTVWCALCTGALS